MQVADSGGWTAESAYAATMQCFQKGGHPRFVICGNDVMASGSDRAVREVRKTTESRDLIRTEVIGYDGIARGAFRDRGGQPAGGHHLHAARRLRTRDRGR